MRPEDFDFAVELANTKNWNMTTADFQFLTSIEPEGCFVLWMGNQRVGLITSVSFGSVGWFGNLIVAEKARCRGAGTLLAQKAVDFLRGKGAKTVGIYAYQDLVGFYGKIGFKTEKEFAVMHAEKINCQIKAAAPKATEADLPLIAGFDKKFFGTDRTKLYRSILTEDNLAFVCKEGDEVVGFVAAKVFGCFTEIGPLVCLPNREETALNLLATVLCSLNGFSASAYLPADEGSLYQMLLDSGFREDFKVSRMFFGPFVGEKCVYIAESMERG
jgi:predicted N-acetyltransferase YhbS